VIRYDSRPVQSGKGEAPGVTQKIVNDAASQDSPDNKAPTAK